MILSAKETTVAYRCPYCGAYVMSLVGVFALSGDLIKLKCSCKKSELLIAYTSDRKIRLTVPCIVCPQSHSYVISSTVFFDKDLFMLNCAYTGIDVCFIGKKDAVLEAAKESDRSLMEMMEQMGLDDFDNLEGIPDDDFEEEDSDTDDAEEEDSSSFQFGGAELYDMSRFLLYEFAADNCVECRCKNKHSPKYELELLWDAENSVRFYCATCGASATYPSRALFYSDGSIRIDEIILI